MIYAKDEKGQRIEPWPGAKAVCPTCGEEVIAKCGSINRWHWSHWGDTDCDPWSEHEGPWHLAWKDYFAPSEREIVIGPHRADIRTKAGRVIELQHSPISAEEIREREEFYGRAMVWILDASEFIQNFDFREKGDYYSFRWKWPRKTWAVAKRPIFLDPGEQGWNEVGNISESIFHLKKMGSDTPVGGWGTWGCKWELLRFFSSQFAAEEAERKQYMERLRAMAERGRYAAS